MRSFFRNYIVDAILVIVLGVFMLVRPFQAIEYMLRIIGIVLLIFGIVKIVVFITGKEERDVIRLLIGIVQVTAGAFLLVKPSQFVGIYSWTWGIVIAYGAIVSLVELIRIRKYDVALFTPAIILALATLVLAVIVILKPAMFSAWATQIIGISLIVEGLSMLLALSRYRG